MASTTRNMWLGIFVLTALLLLITALYFIGNKQNLFGNTFRIGARFYNVNGLTRGNNVRFAGIDVGTVESVEIMNDSTVYVLMVIEDKIHPFIRINALASVGTDGLMGNKLVNINAGSADAPVIKEGQLLHTLRPVEMDVMVRTLDATNQNLEVITSNLRHITYKINNENSLWSLLSDTATAIHVKNSFANIKTMSSGGVEVMRHLTAITGSVNRGEGSLGVLISDTALAFKFKSAVNSLKNVTDSAEQVTHNLSHITRGLKNGEGTAGMLLKDTSLYYNLNQGLIHVKKGASGFDENMEALHSSWPFKRYYKKKIKNSSN